MLWNPTSQYQPNQGMQVLVTFKNEMGTHVDMALYEDGYYYYIEEHGSSPYKEKYDNVTAFQYLPKPHEEIKTYTEIQVDQITADYERKLSDEVAAVRSEWEKKYDELSRVNKALEESKARTSKYNQSLERKNKLLEEEMEKIEECLILFHGTEFDRYTELAEIVNSLVLEVDKYRKKEKELKEMLEERSLPHLSFQENFITDLKACIDDLESKKNEFVEDTFDVMVLRSDLKIPQKEIVTVRHMKYKMPAGEGYQVVAGDYMGEFINIYDCIEVKS